MESSNTRVTPTVDLKEYKKIINKILFNHNISKRDREELSSDLIFVIYEADKNFNGSGNLWGYRKMMANFYIKTFLRKKKKIPITHTVEKTYNVELMAFDYLSKEERAVLEHKFIYKHTVSSFGPNASTIYESALRKVMKYENDY